MHHSDFFETYDEIAWSSDEYFFSQLILLYLPNSLGLCFYTIIKTELIRYFYLKKIRVAIWIWDEAHSWMSHSDWRYLITFFLRIITDHVKYCCNYQKFLDRHEIPDRLLSLTYSLVQTFSISSSHIRDARYLIIICNHVCLRAIKNLSLLWTGHFQYFLFVSFFVMAHLSFDKNWDLLQSIQHRK